MEIATLATAEVMDSREIARLTGKEHRNVCRDIMEQLGQLEGGVLRFEQTYRNEQNGVMYRCFQLPKRECLILASGYEVTLRANIIDRWIELETVAMTAPGYMIPSTKLEALRMALESEERVQVLEAQVSADAPKVAAQDLLAGAGGLFGIREAGKQVGMGQKRFIEFLENSRPKIMYRVAGGGLTPCQIWIDRGYFAVATGTAVHGGDSHAWRQPKFTAKGIAWIAEKVAMERREAA